jgi:hypothetical protein
VGIRRLFGARETQNERLLREAGIGRARRAGVPMQPEAEPALPDTPLDPPVPDRVRARPDEPLPPSPFTFGVARPAEWEALVAAEAPGLQGHEIVFYLLVDGSIIVDTQEGDEPLDPLVEVLLPLVEPPYRARAMHQDDSTWFVGANPIEVVELPGVTADEFTLGVNGGEVVVGDEPVEDTRPYAPIEALAAQRGYTDYAAQASRLEDDTFELALTPL